MSGSATIGDNLVDSLLSVVDDLRDSLHRDMGVRQWRLIVQRRIWDGGRRGEGEYTTAETEILPQPLIMDPQLRYTLTVAGLDEDGVIACTEISLTYIEAELTGRPILDNEDIIYVLRDAHGQGIPDRFYTLNAPPYPDRIDTIGWVVQLRRVDVDECQ